jgi:hypothetical protein
MTERLKMVAEGVSVSALLDSFGLFEYNDDQNITADNSK